MERQGDEVHVSEEEASGGVQPHIVRYVLGVSLLLVVVLTCDCSRAVCRLSCTIIMYVPSPPPSRTPTATRKRVSSHWSRSQPTAP